MAYSLTFEDAVEVWRMRWLGDHQHVIAAHFQVNQGRVNEVLKGRRFPDSEATAASRFPHLNPHKEPTHGIQAADDEAAD